MRTGAAGRRGRRADPSEPTVSARLSRRARSPAPLGAKHWHCWDRECAALRRRVARHFRIQVPGKCMIPSPTVTTSVDSRRRANSANASVTGSSRSGSSSNTVVPSAAPSPARPTHGIRRLPDEAHRRVDADVDPLGRLVALLHRHGPVRSAQGPRGVGRLPHPVEHLLDSRVSVVTLPSGRRSPTAPWSTLNARSLACSLVIRFFARASLIRLSWRCVSEARNRC
jgi:hypothetical protein